MELKELKFYTPTKKDLTRLVKYLEREFPCAVVDIVEGNNIRIMKSGTKSITSITQSAHNWIIAMANHYQVNDVFKLYFWQGNNPITDLIEGTKEYKHLEGEEKEYIEYED